MKNKIRKFPCGCDDTIKGLRECTHKVPAKIKIPAKQSIKHFMHCYECIKTLPDGISPRECAQLEVGLTEIGLQIWCKRHELNVAHINFEGVKHPANTGRR